MQQKMIQFSGDVSLPAIGQGTWYMGEDASQRKTEVAALRAGIELGLTLIDTAEMYADGGAEKVVGEALIGLRENVFLVSKVYPWNAGGQKAINACEASLRRLNTDYLDLYLLHWSGSFALEETVAAMEKLIAQGKIRRWGVSNLDYADMQELWQLPEISVPLIRCFTISVHEGLSTIYFPGARNSRCGDGLQSISPGRAVAQWTVKKCGSQRNCTCSQYQCGTSIVGVGNQPSGCDGDSKSGNCRTCPTKCGCA